MDLQKMGKFIAETRKSKGLTQSQLGEQLGLSGKAISKWERGLSAPDISLLNELSSILDVSISEILSGERSKETINKETANKITMSGLGTYNKIFKKKYSKIILFLSVILILLLLLFSITYLITNYNKCFVYKLSSGNKEFNLEGLIANNQKENSLIITGMWYNENSRGTKEELMVDYIEIILESDDTVISQNDKLFDGVFLNEALSSMNISTNESKKLTKYISNKNLNSLKIVINYKLSDGRKQSLIVPIKIDKKFSNNKIFY